MKWNIDRDYMKEHLAGYVRFQLRQGYEISDVKEALLKYGYDYKLVEEVQKLIDTKQYKPKKKKPSLRELNEDLYIYLQNLLVNYMKKEMEAGYEMEVIRKALIKYGHHPAMVRKAVKSVNDGTIKDLQPKFGFPPGMMLFLSLTIALIFIVFLLLSTEVSVFIVVFSFAPAFVAILISYLVTISDANKKIVQMMPVVGIAIIVILFVTGLQVSPDMRKLSEPGTILLLNVFLGFVCSSCICLFSSKPMKKITVETIKEDT